MGLNLLFGSSCYYLEVIRKGNVSPKKLIGFDDRNARLTRCRSRPCVTPSTYVRVELPFYDLLSKLIKIRLCPKICALTAQASATYTARGYLIVIS